MYSYYGNCVSWDPNDVDNAGGLIELIDNQMNITRRTLLKWVDRYKLADLEDILGYENHHSKGLTMAADWHVTYFKSRLHGELVYGFRHSGIEYVFVAAHVG
jgi:hypothetical protein